MEIGCILANLFMVILAIYFILFRSFRSLHSILGRACDFVICLVSVFV